MTFNFGSPLLVKICPIFIGSEVVQSSLCQKTLVLNLLIYTRLNCVRSLSWSATTLDTLMHTELKIPSRKGLFVMVITPTFQLVHGFCHKVEKILKGSLDSIQSPSVKIQIISGKVCLRCKGKTLLGVFIKLLKMKHFVDYHPTMFCLITSSKLSHQ